MPTKNSKPLSPGDVYVQTGDGWELVGEIKEAAELEPSVEWSKPGPCPVTPEQFNAIYDDEEDEG